MLVFLHQLDHTHIRDSVQDAVIFKTRVTHSMFGTKTPSLLQHALYIPPVGIIFFVLAFTFLVFQYSDCLTRALVGCAVGLVLLRVLWAVWDTRTV